MQSGLTRRVAFGLVIACLPIAAIAQSATVDPPTARDVVNALGGNADNRIYNLQCERLDHRSFHCGFDMPPESQTRHVGIKAVWVGTDWSITILPDETR